MKIGYLVLSIRDINRLLKNAKANRAAHKKAGTSHCIVIQDIPLSIESSNLKGDGHEYFQIHSYAVTNKNNIIG